MERQAGTQLLSYLPRTCGQTDRLHIAKEIASRLARSYANHAAGVTDRERDGRTQTWREKERQIEKDERKMK